ncbi:hypothetical protein AOC06_03665 [Polynucleobacter paludilacus]|uniref:hypothetical protein n=1 Tax=Polynucleobacter paludilacus TaxID=1855895 RepID=UPI001BFE8F9C|nr:hypothetical protein [Polynucleobacter paludilacus]QWD87674.1 hypothetical protein AOC06_03665 [Polynucleobacter paludilacus]
MSAFSLVLCANISAQTSKEESNNPEKETQAKGSGNVTLVFQRESSIVLKDAKIFVDGTQYCALGSGDECTVKTSAGRHILKVDASMTTGEFSKPFTFEDSKTYTFIITRKMSYTVGAVFGMLGTIVNKAANQDENGSDDGTFTMELK